MANPFFLPLPTPLDYFRSLVQEGQSVPLLEAAASLAQDVDPSLDLHLVLDEVDLLAAKLQRRLSADTPALEKLLALNHFFYRELQFAGNVNDYYDPQNSHIHAVLRTRRGIPVSLAVIWLELAERIGLEASGVNFPQHFMVKASLPQGQVVIDPLTGTSLSRDDLLDRLSENKIQVLDDEEGIPVGLFLQSASPQEILERMLRNLQQVYAMQQRPERQLAVLHRLLALLPESWPDYRERAHLLAQMGDVDAAIADLQRYLHGRSDSIEAEDVRAEITRLQGKV